MSEISLWFFSERTSFLLGQIANNYLTQMYIPLVEQFKTCADLYSDYVFLIFCNIKHGEVHALPVSLFS